MSFLSSVFGGSNKTLDSQLPTLTSTSGSLLKSGQSGLNDASSFFHQILNGNFSSLAPQIGAVRKQGTQQLQQVAQFGNRSGGTNSQAQTVTDRTAAGVNDLMQTAKTSAASNIGQIGSTMLNAGLTSSAMAVNDSQMQMTNYLDSILGQSISGAVGTAESYGLGKVFPSK